MASEEDVRIPSADDAGLLSRRREREVTVDDHFEIVWETGRVSHIEIPEASCDLHLCERGRSLQDCE